MLAPEDVETDIRLPKKAQRIYDILRESNESLTRSDIAEQLGKKTLNHADLAYLEVMEVNQMILIETESVRSPHGWQWTYKAVNSDSE